MNRQIVTTGIILNRIDYGEADRIISLITPDNGKLRLMAKGVRRSRSKLAGGIELFSVSAITYIKGRGDLGTLISTRLMTHFGKIVQDIDRTMLGYELIKLLDKATEDEPGEEYFIMLQKAFAALDNPQIHTDTITLWFHMQLLLLSGHQPELHTDVAGKKLLENQNYQFDYDRMAFAVSDKGPFNAEHIKLLRLTAATSPSILEQVKGLAELRAKCLPVLRTVLTARIRTQ